MDGVFKTGLFIYTVISTLEVDLSLVSERI